MLTGNVASNCLVAFNARHMAKGSSCRQVVFMCHHSTATGQPQHPAISIRCCWRSISINMTHHKPDCMVHAACSPLQSYQGVHQHFCALFASDSLHMHSPCVFYAATMLPANHACPLACLLQQWGCPGHNQHCTQAYILQASTKRCRGRVTMRCFIRHNTPVSGRHTDLACICMRMLPDLLQAITEAITTQDAPLLLCWLNCNMSEQHVMHVHMTAAPEATAHNKPCWAQLISLIKTTIPMPRSKAGKLTHTTQGEDGRLAATWKK